MRPSAPMSSSRRGEWIWGRKKDWIYEAAMMDKNVDHRRVFLMDYHSGLLWITAINLHEIGENEEESWENHHFKIF